MPGRHRPTSPPTAHQHDFHHGLCVNLADNSITTNAPQANPARPMVRTIKPYGPARDITMPNTFRMGIARRNRTRHPELPCLLFRSAVFWAGMVSVFPSAATPLSSCSAIVKPTCCLLAGHTRYRVVHHWFGKCRLRNAARLCSHSARPTVLGFCLCVES